MFLFQIESNLLNLCKNTNNLHTQKTAVIDSFGQKKALSKAVSFVTKTLKDPLQTMTLCAPNEKQDKGNLAQKGLSNNTKFDFGATKNHGLQWVFNCPRHLNLNIFSGGYFSIAG